MVMGEVLGASAQVACLPARLPAHPPARLYPRRLQQHGSLPAALPHRMHRPSLVCPAAFTVVAALLMDRAGRRVLLLTSFAGMAACLAALSGVMQLPSERGQCMPKHVPGSAQLLLEAMHTSLPAPGRPVSPFCPARCYVCFLCARLPTPACSLTCSLAYLCTSPRAHPRQPRRRWQAPPPWAVCWGTWPALRLARGPSPTSTCQRCCHRRSWAPRRHAIARVVSARRGWLGAAWARLGAWCAWQATRGGDGSRIMQRAWRRACRRFLAGFRMPPCSNGSMGQRQSHPAGLQHLPQLAVKPRGRLDLPRHAGNAGNRRWATLHCAAGRHCGKAGAQRAGVAHPPLLVDTGHLRWQPPAAF